MPTSPTNPSGTTCAADAFSKYLGRQDMWNVWVKASANQNARSAKVFGRLYWDQMVSPSDPPKTNSRAMVVLWGQLWFVHNNSNSADGVCFDQLSDPPGPTTSTASIPIPRANLHAILARRTRLASSRRIPPAGSSNARRALQYTGFCWQAVTTPNVAQQVNGDKANPNPPMPGTVLGDYARPSSNHPGGVNVTFCDGHYHFLREDVSYYVYQTLMCTRSGEGRYPGGSNPERVCFD